MAMSEKFKLMTDDQKKLFIGRVKKLYEAGVTAEQISEGLNKDMDLVREAIAMIDRANEWKKEHSKL